MFMVSRLCLEFMLILVHGHKRFAEHCAFSPGRNLAHQEGHEGANKQGGKVGLPRRGDGKEKTDNGTVEHHNDLGTDHIEPI